jgi:phosphatidate cytidylyltransferase
MLQRWISAIIAIVILFAILLSDIMVMKIGTIILSLLALYEVFCAFSFQKNPIFVFLGIVSCLLFGVFIKLNPNYIETIAFLSIFTMAIVMIFSHKRVSFIDISILLFLIFVIPFCFTHLIYLRNIKGLGIYYIWLPFIGAFCSDSGAFFVGKAFGGKKLCEELSPKKTISGSIGGFIGSIIGFFIYSLILIYYFKFDINYIPYYILAIICSLTAQIGDLTASAIKRHSHIKDFSNIMPGHGGLMDRVDGLMFTAPMVYIFIFSLGIKIFI